MDDGISNSLRRISGRTRKVAPKMASALASTDNRTQAALTRLEASENDNAGIEMIEINDDDDDDASVDDDDQGSQKEQNVKLVKQEHSRMLRRPLEQSWNFCMRQTWDLYLLICPSI